MAREWPCRCSSSATWAPPPCPMSCAPSTPRTTSGSCGRRSRDRRRRSPRPRRRRSGRCRAPTRSRTPSSTPAAWSRGRAPPRGDRRPDPCPGGELAPRAHAVGRPQHPAPRHLRDVARERRAEARRRRRSGELAKRFGSEQSGRFVNGVLDGLMKSEPMPGACGDERRGRARSRPPRARPASLRSSCRRRSSSARPPAPRPMSCAAATARRC